MTSNPKKTITIVKPDATRAPGLQGPRVFVGDVEIPVESLYVDWEEGTVDVTLAPDEVRIASEVPAPAEPEPAKPGTKEIRFKADPRTFVLSSEGGPGGPFARTNHEITFTSAAPGDDEAVTVSVTLPAPKPDTSPTGCKCSYCDPRGAR